MSDSDELLNKTDRLKVTLCIQRARYRKKTSSSDDSLSKTCDCKRWWCDLMINYFVYWRFHNRVQSPSWKTCFTCTDLSGWSSRCRPVITNTKWKLLKLKLNIWTEVVVLGKIQARLLRNLHHKQKAFWRIKRCESKRPPSHQAAAQKTQQLKPHLNQQQKRSSLAKSPIKVSSNGLSN